MQVSVKWLKDYIEFEETPEALARKLTMAGVPVENIHDPGEGIEKVVTGKITRIEKHPNADKLCVCSLDVGAAEPVAIVTGAANVREGQVVPVAMIGAKLPNGMKIAKGKLRGVVSNGMLCSAAELKLDLEKLPEEQKEGIYILPPDTQTGLDVKEVLGLTDVVLEFELTANRADCFSVLGLVREIAALTGNTPKKPMIRLEEDAGEKTKNLIDVKIDAPALCSRFAVRALKNVKIGPSPSWIKERLEGAGIRSINNVVDATNFVMIEMGQPMHAYDRDMLSGHALIARRANPGETITTLDHVKRETTPEMLVIADTVQAAGIAGVMGGLATEVTEVTKTVVLEAAVFSGAGVRRASRKLGLHSEASGRFERGVDPARCIKALDRAAQLLQEMGACTVCEGVVDVYPGFELPAAVTFTPEQINRRLGSSIEKRTMIHILKSLEFDVNDERENIVVTVPSWRGDVRCMADISEEISRVYGFGQIESTLPEGPWMQGGQSAEQSFVDRAKLALSGAGLYETISFSFAHPSMFDRLNMPEDSALRRATPLLNPITDEFPLLRTTLLGSVLETVARNLSRKNEDIQIFEIGSVYLPKELPIKELPDERLMICGALAGRRNEARWNQAKAAVDFFDAKGVVELLLDKLNVSTYTVEAGEHYAMHPGKTAVFKKGRTILAHVGELHPKAQANMNIAKKTYIFELDVHALMNCASSARRCQSLPKYPPAGRDLAMVVSQSVTAGEIEKEMVKSAGALLNGIRLFDVYTGEQIEAGQKSLAFSLQFQSADKTLTDEEIDRLYQRVVETLETKFSAKLRS